MSHGTSAQAPSNEWQLAYFSPFASGLGGLFGFAFGIKEWEGASTTKKKHVHALQLLNQLGYYTQANVSHNLIFNPELVYRWNKTENPFFLSTSIGGAYLLSFQRQLGTLNMATGETDYRHQEISYFLPNVNASLGYIVKKHVGFSLKATFGQKLNNKNAHAAFVGLSATLTIRFKAKQQ